MGICRLCTPEYFPLGAQVRGAELSERPRRNAAAAAAAVAVGGWRRGRGENGLQASKKKILWHFHGLKKNEKKLNIQEKQILLLLLVNINNVNQQCFFNYPFTPAALIPPPPSDGAKVHGGRFGHGGQGDSQRGGGRGRRRREAGGRRRRREAAAAVAAAQGGGAAAAAAGVAAQQLELRQIEKACQVFFAEGTKKSWFEGKYFVPVDINVESFYHFSSENP